MNENFTKSELELLLKSDNKKTVADALLYICFNVCDHDWIQDKLIDVIINNPDVEIKGLGITCVGHVARMNPGISLKKVMRIIKAELKNPILSGRAQDALNDIEIFSK